MIKSFTMKLIISSIAILTLMMTLLSFTTLSVYRKSFNEEIERYSLDRLEFVKDTVDMNYFSVVEKACISILGEKINSPVNQLFSLNAKQNYNLVKDAHESLQLQHLKLLDFAESINMYYSTNNMIVSTKTGVHFLNDRGSGEWIRDKDWIEQMNEYGYSKNMWICPRITKDTSSRDRINVFTYLYSSFHKKSGFLYVNIEEDTIRSALDETILSEDGYLILMDYEGLILSHPDKEQIYSNVSGEKWFGSVTAKECFTGTFEINGEESVVSAVRSDFLNMYYVYIVDTGEYYQSSTIVGNTIRNILCLFLIAAGFVAGLWAYANAMPVRRLVDKVQKNQVNKLQKIPRKNDIELIEGVFVEMDEKLTYLNDLMDKNRQIIKNTVFSSLLAGESNAKQDLRSVLEFSGIKIEKRLTCSLIVQMDTEIVVNTDVINTIFTFISDYVSENEYMKIAVAMNDKDICIVMNVDQEEQVQKEVYKMADFFKNKIHAMEISVPIHFGIGDCYSELNRLSDSYRAAREVVEYVILFPERIVFSSREYHKREDEVPKDIIEKIVKSLRKETSEAEAINELKTYLYDIGNVKAYRQSKSLIIENMEKLLMRNKAEGEQNRQIVENLRHTESMDEFLDGLTIFMRNYDRTEFANVQYVRDAKVYIEEHLEEMFSAEEIAQFLNINSSYFSRIFKNSTGENFTEYVTRIRMEKAAGMLKETNLSVRQIADKTGYRDNYSYFGRKFKATFDTTPGEYRKKNIHD